MGLSALLILLACPAWANPVKASNLPVSKAEERSQKSLIELIRKSETQYQSKSAFARVLMSISKKNWKRSILMENWSMGRDRFLARIEKPKKERGNSTLIEKAHRRPRTPLVRSKETCGSARQTQTRRAPRLPAAHKQKPQAQDQSGRLQKRWKCERQTLTKQHSPKRRVAGRCAKR